MNHIARVLNLVLAAYPSQAVKLPTQTIAAMLEVWQSTLSDLDPDLLSIAARRHIERSEFMPTVAEIRQAAIDISRQASPAQETAQEAWAKVRQSILSYGHNRQVTFANPITQAVVNQFGWYEMCTSEDPEAVNRAQFIKAYETQLARLEDRARQSPAVREFVAQLAARMAAPMLEDTDGARPALRH